MFSKFSKMKILNLLLVLMISVTVPLQAVSSTVFAASATTSSSDTSAASDESIDDWMPDKNLQKLVYAALHSESFSSDDHGGNETTAISQITPAMLADIRYLNTGNADEHVTGITDLTGLQYATGLKTVNLTGSIIKKAPGDWSAFDGVSVQSSLDGTTYDGLNDGLVVDATSADADLKDLAASTVSYKLVNGNDIGMPNHADNPDAPKAGINITTLTPGKNMTYDSDLSSMKAYIPLSDWYKGFMTDDGTFKYTDVTTEKLSDSPANGVTWDSANHRFVVDLNICGGHEIKIPSFTIGDHSTDGKASYYNQGNTLDAVVPMSSVPADTSQTVDVSSRTDPTGSINTATFGFGSATDAQLTINSGDLTADDITFTPDLAENKINFTLTSSGEQKLRAGDLESNITIAAGGASVKLTLKLAESLDTWMPSKALQTALKNAGVTTLTKSNLASFNGPLKVESTKTDHSPWY